MLQSFVIEEMDYTDPNWKPVIIERSDFRQIDNRTLEIDITWISTLTTWESMEDDTVDRNIISQELSATITLIVDHSGYWIYDITDTGNWLSVGYFVN
jgi:hypothetical protein